MGFLNFEYEQERFGVWCSDSARGAKTKESRRHLAACLLQVAISRAKSSFATVCPALSRELQLRPNAHHGSR